MDERWLPVPGYEDLYEVSDQGRFKSLRKNKIMSPAPQYKGHMQVALYKGGSRIPDYVHRLVLLAFTGPAPAGTECRHLDGNPRNNRLENLAWGTRSENSLDDVVHGRN